MEVLLFKPLLLDILSFLIGLAHEIIRLMNGGFALLDGSDLLMNGSW